MAAEVVENNDVAGAQLRDEELLDVGAEDDSVDGTIDDAGRGQRIGSESRQDVRVRQRPATGGDIRAILLTGKCSFFRRTGLRAAGCARPYRATRRCRARPACP